MRLTPEEIVLLGFGGSGDSDKPNTMTITNIT